MRFNLPNKIYKNLNNSLLGLSSEESQNKLWLRQEIKKRVK